MRYHSWIRAGIITATLTRNALGCGVQDKKILRAIRSLDSVVTISTSRKLQTAAGRLLINGDIPNCTPAFELYSLEGEELFDEARRRGTAVSFLPLMSYYNTESEPKYYGAASLSMVLNALKIDPRKGGWINRSMLIPDEELAELKKKSTSLGKDASEAETNEAKVLVCQADHSNIDIFRSSVSLCSSINNLFMILSYDREDLGQTGAGHFSPVGAYHARHDMVLILDVAQHKYPPHWVPLDRLWDAMHGTVESTQNHGGFMIVSRDCPCKEPSILYSKIYGHEGWNRLLIYLIKDFPLFLDAEHVLDIEKILSVAFDTSPIGLRVLIPWISEVGNQEDGHVLKEDLLMQIRDTKLFSYVSAWLESKVGRGIPSTDLKSDQNGYIGMHPSTGDILTLLLFGMPKIIWSHIQEDYLRHVITSLASVYKPPFLQEEVLNLRRELEFLMIDLVSASIAKSK